MAYKTILKNIKGYTLIELIIVIAILIIIATAGTPIYLSFYRFNQLDTTANEITQTLRKAQSYALSGLEGTGYSVYFIKNETDNFSYFHFTEDGINSSYALLTKQQCQDNIDCHILPAGLEYSELNLPKNPYGSSNYRAFFTGSSDIVAELKDEGITQAWVRIKTANTTDTYEPSAFEEEPDYGISDPPPNVTIAVCHIKESCVDTGMNCEYIQTNISNCCCTSLAQWAMKRYRNLDTLHQIEVAQIEGEWLNPDIGDMNDWWLKNISLLNGTDEGQWTTKADNFIKIYVAPSARHIGKWNNKKYRLKLSGESTLFTEGVISIKTPYVKIEGLQIEATGDKSIEDGVKGIYIDSGGSAGNVEITKTIIKATGTQIASAETNAIDIKADANVSLWNNLIYGMWHTGIRAKDIDASPTYQIYNNTIYHCAGDMATTKPGAVYISGSTLMPNIYLINNIAQDTCQFDHSDTDPVICPPIIFTVNNYYTSNSNILDKNNNITDENSVFNYEVNFINTSTANFHLNLSDLIAAGEGETIPGFFANDIDSQIRPQGSSWDIGADESGQTAETWCPKSTRRGITISINQIGKINRCQ